MKVLYRAQPGKSDGCDHFLGGKPIHDNAVCPNCKNPLLMFWNLNAKDSRFPRGKFPGMERVPLYFCWLCVSDLRYQVGPKRLKFFPWEHKREGNNRMYEPFPQYYPPRPLGFTDAPMPKDARKVYSTWDGWKTLPIAMRTKFAQFFGHPVRSRYCCRLTQ